MSGSATRPHLQVEGLGKRFRLHATGQELIALRDVSFAVERGEFVGVVGRSGSGKSSLIRCLFRRYRATTGRVLYRSGNGELDLGGASDQAIADLRRAELGYVAQFLHAVPRLSAVDVVADALVRRGDPSNAARARASDVLTSLGISTTLQRATPATMSGGERQRVNLARAIVARPRLLLLDEPTSALDAQTRELVVEAIRELKEAGTTMVGVFHDAPALRAVADSVLVLDHGRASWHGAIEDSDRFLNQEGS